jgi:hypothetical protein
MVKYFWSGKEPKLVRVPGAKRCSDKKQTIKNGMGAGCFGMAIVVQ